MKKINLVLLLFATIFCYGNDIIITQKSEKIDATIIEVSPTEIKYRKVSNPTGPIFVISINDISSIIYSNGDVEVFTVDNSTNNVQNDISSNSQNSYAANVKNGSLITRVGSNCYVHNGQAMDSHALGDFLQINCQPAYEQWKKGDIFQKFGITYAVLGPVLCLPLGLTLYACADDGAMYYSSVFFMTLGAGLTVASVPFLVIGTKNKNNAYITYNNHLNSSHKPDLSLNFQVKTDGLGLALKF